jgi:hypothetical protein
MSAGNSSLYEGSKNAALSHERLGTDQSVENSLYEGSNAALSQERLGTDQLVSKRSPHDFFQGIREAAEGLLDLASFEGVPKHLYGRNCHLDDGSEGDPLKENTDFLVESYMPRNFLLDYGANKDHRIIHIFSGRIHCYVEFEKVGAKGGKSERLTFRFEISDTEEVFKRLTINGCTFTVPAKKFDSDREMFDDGGGGNGGMGMPVEVKSLEELATHIVRDYEALNSEAEIPHAGNNLFGGWCIKVKEEGEWDPEDFEEVLRRKGLSSKDVEFSTACDEVLAEWNLLNLRVTSVYLMADEEDCTMHIVYMFHLHAWDVEERRRNTKRRPTNKKRKT